MIDFGAVVAFFGAVCWLLAGKRDRADARTAFAACGLGLLFVYLTLELNTLMHTYLDGLRYGAVSILWTVFALAFLLRGIHQRVATMRYAGLALFTVVVFKVFFVDLRGSIRSIESSRLLSWGSWCWPDRLFIFVIARHLQSSLRATSRSQPT